MIANSLHCRHFSAATDHTGGDAKLPRSELELGPRDADREWEVDLDAVRIGMRPFAGEEVVGRMQWMNSFRESSRSGLEGVGADCRDGTLLGRQKHFPVPRNSGAGVATFLRLDVGLRVRRRQDLTDQQDIGPTDVLGIVKASVHKEVGGHEVGLAAHAQEDVRLEANAPSVLWTI
jgi:hypothetical protein